MPKRSRTRTRRTRKARPHHRGVLVVRPAHHTRLAPMTIGQQIIAATNAKLLADRAATQGGRRRRRGGRRRGGARGGDLLGDVNSFMSGMKQGFNSILHPVTDMVGE
jgi:hypothetical protein